MASKDDIVGAIEKSQSEVEQVVKEMPESAWSSGVYEDGWNAGQLLCHLASTSGIAGFILNMAQATGAPPEMPGGAAFNIDDFNKQQVALREGKPTDELLAEIRSTLQKDIGAIRAADDSLIAKHYKAPWDAEGPVGDMIVDSLNGHFGQHIADLRSATA